MTFIRRFTRILGAFAVCLLALMVIARAEGHRWTDQYHDVMLFLWNGSDGQRVAGDTAGDVFVAGGEANNVAPVSNPLQLAGYAMTDGTAPTATTAGNVTRLLTTRDGRLITATDHPKRFTCTVVNSTATTLTAFGGSCAAPGASLSLYITDINASASAASTTTADQQLEVKSGTGGTCGAGTAVIWNQYGVAFTSIVAQFITPIKITANNELCWMDAVTGNKSFTVNGYIAP
jgi:hypothetical protein